MKSQKSLWINRPLHQRRKYHFPIRIMLQTRKRLGNILKIDYLLKARKSQFSTSHLMYMTMDGDTMNNSTARTRLFAPGMIV